MKKIVSVLLLSALLISFVPYAFAEDNFKVSHIFIKDNDDVKAINIVMPIFEGFNGADKVNKKVLDIALDALGDANSNAKSMLPIKKELVEKGELAASMVVSLDMNYDYVRLGDILSVQLNIDSYYGGAHGTSQIISITSNTSTGEIYQFKDLFKEDVDYASAVNKYIIKEIEKNPQMYFPNYKENIKRDDNNYEFYIDGDKLVVYFGLYDIAPYAAGIRHFIMDSEDIKDILKDEVYNSIKGGKERGIINYNGKTINSDLNLINQNYTTLLPLRFIAETLGYEVDWNKNDGAIVAGKIVSVEPLVIIDGTTYVPPSYFRYQLGENVSLGIIGNDKTIVRVYGKSSAKINNSSLIKEYVSPETAQDAVYMYAEAVKHRNGMVQYALLDDNLREEKYDDYKGFDFVTGASSPWVDSYEIIQLEENLFKIIKTYRTSVPTDIFISEIIVRVVEDGQYYKISSVE